MPALDSAHQARFGALCVSDLSVVTEMRTPDGEGTDAFVLLLQSYEGALTNLQKAPVEGAKIAQVLALRDQIAVAISEHSFLAVRQEELIAQLDARLRDQAKSWRRSFDARFVHARELIQPARERWWWYLDARNPLWVVGALFFFTVSISMLTDFTRRLLISDPDVVGILAIAVQALFTVGASSTLTVSGRRWLGNVFKSWRVPVTQQEPLKFWAMAVLAVVTFAVWTLVPPALAGYYNDRGLAIAQTQPAVALRDYNRALSLNPSKAEPHVNLAGAYVRDFEFGSAIAEYQKALLLNVSDLTAYNNLAYVLLLSNDPTTALSVIDDAFTAVQATRSVSLTNDVKGALYKNLASAEYALGFVWKANEDINRSLKIYPTREVYCTLAKIDTKLGLLPDALEAWKTMIATPPRQLQPLLEPDCIRLAEEALYAHK
jgi:tetratricopeptide (TPR) repeat protein